MLRKQSLVSSDLLRASDHTSASVVCQCSDSDGEVFTQERTAEEGGFIQTP